MKELTTKQKRKIYKANKHYDKHMAGKYNPKLQEYNFELQGSKERKVGGIPSNSKICECGNTVYTTSTMSGFICSKCGSFNKVSI